MRHLIIGTLLIALGLWGISSWWEAFAFVMRAVVPLASLVIGVLAVLSSYSRLGANLDHDDVRDGEHLEE